MTRRNRRIPAPTRPTFRRKDKDVLPFPELLKELKTYELSKSDVHELLEYLYARYEGEYRYYNRLLSDQNKKIV